MIRICAWCKIDMGEKEPFEDRSISHGMCEPCSIDILKSNQEEKRVDKGEKRCYNGVGSLPFTTVPEI